MEPGPVPARRAFVDQPAEAVEAPALRDRPSHLRFWGVVVLGLGLDLWSKHWAFQALGQGGGRILIPNVLEFHTTLNAGALFGLGKGQTSLFVLASLLALTLVLWMFAQCPRRRWLTQIALGAILAGALGNMYDRVFVQLHGFPDPTAPGGGRYYIQDETSSGDWIVLREYPPSERSQVLRFSPDEKLGPPVGHVRDFIKISQKWFGGRDVWPWVFNVADMLLVGGVGILAVRLLRDRRSQATFTKPDLDAAREKT